MVVSQGFVVPRTWAAAVRSWLRTTGSTLVSRDMDRAHLRLRYAPHDPRSLTYSIFDTYHDKKFDIRYDTRYTVRTYV